MIDTFEALLELQMLFMWGCGLFYLNHNYVLDMNVNTITSSFASCIIPFYGTEALYWWGLHCFFHASNQSVFSGHTGGAVLSEPGQACTAENDQACWGALLQRH